MECPGRFGGPDPKRSCGCGAEDFSGANWELSPPLELRGSPIAFKRSSTVVEVEEIGAAGANRGDDAE